MIGAEVNAQLEGVREPRRPPLCSSVRRPLTSGARALSAFQLVELVEFLRSSSNSASDERLELNQAVTRALDGTKQLVEAPY